MKVSRRYFMYGALLAGAIPRGGFGSVVSLKALGYQSPNDKLNIAGIGVGGRGGSDLAGVASENIVALADVDANALAAGKQRYPNATTFNDFRQMLDKQAKGIDAVTIGTPDHMHGIAALSAMQLGKHVYVEKPLVRTPWEARILAQAAAKYKVATQMGNQGYSHEATRMVHTPEQMVAELAAIDIDLAVLFPDHLLKLPVANLGLFQDVGKLALREIVLNRYFRPFRPLEFRVEYDRLRSVRLLDTLGAGSGNSVPGPEFGDLDPPSSSTASSVERASTSDASRRRCTCTRPAT